MTRKKLILTILVLFLLGLPLGFWLKSEGISLDGLAGLAGGGVEKNAGTGRETSAPRAGNDKSAPEPPEPELRFDHVRLLFGNLEPEQRRRLIGDQQRFRQFVRQEARNESLLAAARANNLQDDANVSFLRQRAADNVVRELYMKTLIQSKIPKDFPGDDRIREYYDQHKDQFKVGDRIQIWQIFLPITDNMKDAGIKALEDKADGLVKDLRAGKTSFAEAAYRYSEHEPSRSNGGYMGLIKVADLRPAIGEALAGLQEGRVSDPVRTGDGVHIFRKGTTVPGRLLPLEQVRGQVRQALLKQAVRQLQQAIYDQAASTYPVNLAESKIEEWRLRLRTDTKGEE